MFGSGSPFIAQTIRLFWSIAFLIGTPRDSAGRLAIGEAAVDAVVAGEHGGRLHARGAQHVGEPHAGPFGAAGAAIGPLVAARLSA